MTRILVASVALIACFCSYGTVASAKDLEKLKISWKVGTYGFYTSKSVPKGVQIRIRIAELRDSGKTPLALTQSGAAVGSHIKEWSSSEIDEGRVFSYNVENSRIFAIRSRGFSHIYDKPLKVEQGSFYYTLYFKHGRVLNVRILKEEDPF